MTAALFRCNMHSMTKGKPFTKEEVMAVATGDKAWIEVHKVDWGRTDLKFAGEVTITRQGDTIWFNDGMMGDADVSSDYVYENESVIDSHPWTFFHLKD